MKYLATVRILLAAACVPLAGAVTMSSILDGIASAASNAGSVINALGDLGHMAAGGFRRGTITHAFDKLFNDVDNGTNPINFAGGNIGAYYNFMYPENDDYPWACVCNEHDLQLYREKQLPYARCRNQEDLSFNNFQANCDPISSANVEF